MCKARLVVLLKDFAEVFFKYIPCSSTKMADAVTVLGSRLLRVGESGEPIILFARQDAPVGALLPTSMLE